MSLCDQLEAGLMRSQVDSEKLIRAVAGRMLAGDDEARFYRYCFARFVKVDFNLLSKIAVIGYKQDVRAQTRTV